MGEVVIFPPRVDIHDLRATLSTQVAEAGFTEADIVASSARQRQNINRLHVLFDSLPD